MKVAALVKYRTRLTDEKASLFADWPIVPEQREACRQNLAQTLDALIALGRRGSVEAATEILGRCVERYNELDDGFICTIEREELCEILYEIGGYCGLDEDEEMDVMRMGIPFAVCFALLVLIAGPVRAQSLRCRAATARDKSYGLTYLCIPYHPHSAWRWVLRPGADSPKPNRRIEAKSLDAPVLRDYIGALPAGATIELMWQFKKADLTHQAGMASLGRLCARRRIHLPVFAFSGT